MRDKCINVLPADGVGKNMQAYRMVIHIFSFSVNCKRCQGEKKLNQKYNYNVLIYESKHWDTQKVLEFLIAYALCKKCQGHVQYLLGSKHEKTIFIHIKGLMSLEHKHLDVYVPMNKLETEYMENKCWEMYKHEVYTH